MMKTSLFGMLTLVFVLFATMQQAMAEEPLKFSKTLLCVDPNEGCDVGDVDNDGDMDIVAGRNWYPGPDFVPHALRDIESMGADYFTTNGDHLFDVNQDGWPDVVASGWNDTEICWYENPGKIALQRGMKWPRHVLAEGKKANEAFFLHDMNGDEVPEIIVSSWKKQNPVMVWRFVEKDGSPALLPFELGKQGGGHGLAFGDVDGDGDEDLLTELGWYERPEGDPLAAAWEFHPETALPHPSCPFLVVDVNQDGRNDLIWGKAHDYGLFWWEQGKPKADGTTTWTEHLIDDSWSQPHYLAWSDLDGDEKPELITGKRVRAHSGNDPGGKEPAVLYYYTWDPERASFTRHTIGAPGEGIGIGMQIRTTDMNDDGRTDIVVAGKTGTWLLINQGK